ncbi:phenylalanine--tRNA ligase subunit alpha [Candidatus Peregrinibacteria bacterium]|nr:phenylalanine--tRNA ligase subunit alpha [Candidatus Peregrinibacteria bacterium]
MENQLKNLQTAALKALEGIKDEKSLKDLEVQYLGRKGKLTEILRGLKNLPDEKKPMMGQLSNKTKATLEEALAQKLTALAKGKLEKELSGEFFDTTIPGTAREIGHIHPLCQVQEEVERIFYQMGFAIADGPEVESEYYNFEGLNISKDHPARDMQDTFFIANKEHKDSSHRAGGHGRMVLRTHTSPVQVRMLEKYGAPTRVIIPGRVFRNEATDASHEHTFNQVEGLLIDKDISMGHLKGVMAEFLTRLFGKPVKVRFRPGYFPFVEPGLELDFSCLLCEGTGKKEDCPCRVCKKTGWVEFMGAGMTHEKVLEAGGVDPKKYQGWAFGFGLTRLTMMRHGITDIRLLASGDLRFSRQF